MLGEDAEMEAEIDKIETISNVAIYNWEQQKQKLYILQITHSNDNDDEMILI